MSGVKHTPGRWRTVGVHQGHPQHLRLFGPDGKRVCYLPQAYTDEAKRLNEANARLIASAPDLLEALAVLVTDCSQIWSEAEFPALKQARAAIARARGEQEGGGE